MIRREWRDRNMMMPGLGAKPDQVWRHVILEYGDIGARLTKYGDKKNKWPGHAGSGRRPSKNTD